MTARALQWTGAVDHATFNTPGNWNDLTNGGAASGTTPVTGDTCNIVDTGDLINAGLSQSSVVLAALNIGANYTGQLGPGGSPLIISATMLTYLARAAYCAVTAGSSNITTAIIQGAGTFTASGGTWTTFSCGPNGVAYLTASSTIVNYKGDGGGARADAGTAFTTCKVGAGSLVSARGLGTGYVAGSGTLLQTILAAASTSIDVLAGARFNINSTGTNAAIEVASGGILDSIGAILPAVVTTLTKRSGSSCFAREMVTPVIGSTVTLGNTFLGQ